MYIVEMKCPKCGRNFIPAPMHVFKTKTKVYCSWTCYNHRDDKKKRYHYKTVQQLTPDGEVVTEIKGLENAAGLVNGNATSVSDAIRTKTTYKGYRWRYKDEMSQMSK